MIRCFLTFCALALAPISAQAQTSLLVPLDTLQATQGWQAVGRLDIGTDGFCTGTLIDDDLVLTAAHCVFDASGAVLPAEDFLFQAGLRNGRADATRTITRVLAHPAYVPDGPTAQIDGVGQDIALLTLSQPIRLAGITPFPIASHPDRGDEVALVSYGRNRADAPSLQATCRILSRIGEALVTDCEAEFGSSGAPIFQIREGAAQIVSVVSAVGQSGDRTVSLGTSLKQPLQTLRTLMAAAPEQRSAPGSARLITIGERGETGAKFVRP